MKEGRQSRLSTPDTVAYLAEMLKDPLPEVGANVGSTKGRRRTYRMHGSSPTWAKIFETLKGTTGKEYEVTYLDVESAKEKEQQAIADGNVDAELAAGRACLSRETTTGSQRSNLRAWRSAFTSEKYRKFYRLA
jgi:hypothetical protein